MIKEQELFSKPQPHVIRLANHATWEPIWGTKRFAAYINWEKIGEIHKERDGWAALTENIGLGVYLTKEMAKEAVVGLHYIEVNGSSVDIYYRDRLF